MPRSAEVVNPVRPSRSDIASSCVTRLFGRAVIPPGLHRPLFGRAPAPSGFHPPPLHHPLLRLGGTLRVDPPACSGGRTLQVQSPACSAVGSTLGDPSPAFTAASPSGFHPPALHHPLLRMRQHPHGSTIHPLLRLGGTLRVAPPACSGAGRQHPPGSITRLFSRRQHPRGSTTRFFGCSTLRVSSPVCSALRFYQPLVKTGGSTLGVLSPACSAGGSIPSRFHHPLCGCSTLRVCSALGFDHSLIRPAAAPSGFYHPLVQPAVPSGAIRP